MLIRNYIGLVLIAGAMAGCVTGGGKTADELAQAKYEAEVRPMAKAKVQFEGKEWEVGWKWDTMFGVIMAWAHRDYPPIEDNDEELQAAVRLLTEQVKGECTDGKRPGTINVATGYWPPTKTMAVKFKCFTEEQMRQAGM